MLINECSPHAPHAHSDEEMLLLLSGDVDLIIQDDRAGGYQHLRLEPGQFVYYPANFDHTLQTKSEQPANYLMFRWQGAAGKKGHPLALRHFTVAKVIGGAEECEGFQTRQIFEGPTEYLQKLHCHFSTLSSGAGYPPHADPYNVAIIMLEGEVETLGQRAKPFDVIFYAAGELHGMRNPAGTTAKYIVFEFHGRRGLLAQKSRHLARSFLLAAVAWRPRRRKIPACPKPRSVCLDASTACQLKCPSCPTANGAVAKGLGAGFLRYEDFKKFVDENRFVSQIELSNHGEIFLNPELRDIIQYAHKKKVPLTAYNGVNLNKAADDVLEALVKYRFRGLSVSIDGASPEAYATYRVNGDYERVLENIARINRFKEKYRSRYPRLEWQFIAFGHNEHEINPAKAKARELNMGFHLKLNWEDFYTDTFSPIKDKDLIRRETGLGVADRREYERKYGRSYTGWICTELWLTPRINYDGRLLGCSTNHWGDYGNVFERGLENCLKSEALNHAKQMLLGLEESREGIPCSSCKVYANRKRMGLWITPGDFRKLSGENVMIIWLKGKLKRKAKLWLDW